MASPPPRASWSAALVESSFRLSWDHRDDLLRIGLVPGIVSFLLQLAEQLLDGDAALPVLELLVIVPVSAFSVASYRLLLLGPAALPAGFLTGFGRREVRYILLTLAVGMIGSLVLGIPLVLFGAANAGHPMLLILASCVAALLAIGGFARFCLVFPACAVDAPMSLAESVRRTAGAGKRLWLALLGIGAISIAALMLAIMLLYALGLLTAAPLASSFLLTALAYAATAVMLVPPALAFRELSGWRGPAAPPLSAVS